MIYSVYSVPSVLKRLNSVNLITVGTSSHEGKIIRVSDLNKFLASAGKVYDEFKEVFSASSGQERELIDLDELAKVINVPSEAIYKRICHGEAPREVLYFSREGILKWLGEKGADFFKQE